MNRRNFLKVLGVSVPAAVAMVEAPEVKASPGKLTNVVQCVFPVEECPDAPTMQQIRVRYSRTVPIDAKLVRADFDADTLQWVATLSHPTFKLRMPGCPVWRVQSDEYLIALEEWDKSDGLALFNTRHPLIEDDQYGIINRCLPARYTLKDTIPAIDWPYHDFAK